MHQLINKKKLYFYLLSFLLLTTIINQNLLQNLEKNFFLVRNINVNTESKELKDQIIFNLKYLKNENIFFIDKNIIKSKLNELKFFENLIIKKKYPSTILVNAKQTNLIAITYINQKKYYLGENGKFILANTINSKKKLPIIFGKFEASDYIDLKNKLKNLNINYNSITKYFFHKNKRWDLYYPKNIILKLPNKNIIDAMNLYKTFKNLNKIKPNTVIDLRIQNRLILKNE